MCVSWRFKSVRYSSTNYHPLFDDESSPRAHTLICARTLTCCCTSLPAELDPPLCFYSELIHSVLIMAAAEAKTLKDNMCAAMTCQFCHIVIEMFAFFFLPRFLTHSLGLNPPDCMWPWTVCHLPAFTPSVTMLFTLSLR